MTGAGGKIDYSYDANGNLTQKTMASYTDTYAYNVKNQLTNYSGYDGYQQRYSYNAQGHMIKRESKGSASRQTLEAIAASSGEHATADRNMDIWRCNGYYVCYRHVTTHNSITAR